MAKVGIVLSLVTALLVGLIPALAPRRSPQIAFESFQDGDSDIYLLDAATGIPHKLTRHPSDDFAPTWSPDGRWIAFASNRTDNYEVYVMDANGGHVQNLTRHASDDFTPAWSPDGSQIAFISRRQGNSEIYIMEVMNILANPACTALPDMFFVNENQPCAPPIRRLTDSSVDEAAPAWSPDGRSIAFVQAGDRDSEIVAMRVNCGDPMQGCPGDRNNLSDDPARDTDPSWSPDGRYIAFASNRGGAWNIYRMRADGSQVHRLTQDAGTYVFPSWSPDGQQIVFAGQHGTEWALYTMNADGSNIRRLTYNRVEGFRSAWRP